jgi:thermopsin
MFAVRALVIGAVAVFVALLMVSPGGSALGAPPLRLSPAGSASAIASHASPSAGNAAENRILAELRATHADLKDAFLPNLNVPARVESGTITPDYAQAPAPMGIGDLGVQDVHGKNVGTVAYTSSVEASVTLNALNSTYLDGFGPDSVSMQLNTVLTNVDLFGNTQNQFWIQNVPVYVESTHKLYIVDNIWNFSSSAFEFTPNSLYKYSGFEYPPVYYFANGPQWTTGEPFTVRVFNNASVMNDRPTVFLNYSITLSNGTTVAGSYDEVEFNSTGLATPTYPAPMPTFQIDGQQLGAQGALPNDAEIMLGGSSDGATTSISAVNATMTLATLPNASATYVSVPAAYNFGFDTGETAEGISEWASSGPSPTAHLASGPSLLRPLWGMVGAVSGFVPVQFSVAPSNAFAFASVGTAFRAGTAAWAPVLANGSADYQLPPGHYAFDFLLSDHNAKVVLVSGPIATVVTLVADPSVGITTPLYGWGNAQLAAISQSGGTGTVGHPYVLLNAGTATLNPLFGEFNDFEFPVFSGILLVDTTAFVTVTNAPSFFVAYSLPIEAKAVALDGQPSYNYLQQEYYRVQHVSIVDNPSISGWYPSSDVGTMYGSVLFWNSSANLVAGNTFDDMSVGLFVYGGSNDVVWGNTFTVSLPVCSYPPEVFNDPGNETGIVLSANNDLLYNNYFDVPAPAVTPTSNVLTFTHASYHDVWNVSSLPLHTVRVVNGFSLFGNIVGGPRQGGNFWSTYGTPADPYGVLPFNAAGGISAGGDQLPLTPFALHALMFREKGLPVSQPWSVTINGVTFGSTGTTISFVEPAGTYAYVVGPIAGFTPHPATGAVTVGNGAASATIGWT